jgi:hypothetical protein
MNNERTTAEELLRQYFEMQAELQSHEAMVKDVRTQLHTLVKTLGQVKLDHIGSAVIVPESISYSYDADMLDTFMAECLTNGDVHTARKLADARKDTPRKASLRISTARKGQ